MTNENKVTKEIWKDVKGFEQGYQISNLGRIKSKSRIVNYGIKKALRPSKILKTRKGKTGYYYTVFSLGKIRKTVKPHRLVAEHFISNPENKPQVNHKDGDKSNNIISNLEWNTAKENVKHAYNNGLSKGVRGEKSHYSKLKKHQVEEIRKKYHKGDISQSNLGKQYNVSQGQIYRIVNNLNWTKEHEN